MSRLVFLLEEPSMAELLRGVIPKIFPGWVENQHWLAVPHNGRSDLEASVPRKLRAWNRPDDRFIIMRDNDGGDCRAHKARLLRLAEAAPQKRTLVRIVCQELESWLLGDLDAVESAFPSAARAIRANRRRYPDPDRLTNAAQELFKLTQTPGKVGPAKAISVYMKVEVNLSHSFGVFVEGVRRHASD